MLSNNDEILLLLRDNKAEIPYPDMWDVPGGHLEEGESEQECIRREIREEMGIVLNDIHLFKIYDFSDRIEHTFWKRIDLEIGAIDLQEGQRLKWFSRDLARATPLAYGFNSVVDEFFREAPFRVHSNSESEGNGVRLS